MIRADARPEPNAALAIVLAISIAAWSIACSGQIRSRGPGQKLGEVAGNGHGWAQRGSVQLSEKARAQVLNGRPSRCTGQGRPAASLPSTVSRAPRAGINRVHTP